MEIRLASTIGIVDQTNITAKPSAETARELRTSAKQWSMFETVCSEVPLSPISYEMDMIIKFRRNIS